jgi:hypothetical protein
VPKDCRAIGDKNGVDDSTTRVCPGQDGWMVLVSEDDLREKDGRPKDKAMLAVTRLPPGAVCHVAYVDVAANSNANELARQAADERQFVIPAFLRSEKPASAFRHLAVLEMTLWP